MCNIIALKLSDWDAKFHTQGYDALLLLFHVLLISRWLQIIYFFSKADKFKDFEGSWQ